MLEVSGSKRLMLSKGHLPGVDTGSGTFTKRSGCKALSEPVSGGGGGGAGCGGCGGGGASRGAAARSGSVIGVADR